MRRPVRLPVRDVTRTLFLSSPDVSKCCHNPILDPRIDYVSYRLTTDFGKILRNFAYSPGLKGACVPGDALGTQFLRCQSREWTTWKRTYHYVYS